MLRDLSIDMSTKIKATGPYIFCSIPLEKSFLVAFNFPPESKNALDVGKKRSLHEILTINGYTISINEVAICKFIMTPWEKGTVARIFTGAEPPSGSDCIIMQEDVKKTGDQKVELLKSLEVGENIRKRACDLKTGEVFFKKGRQLSSADLGLCASVGKVSM